MRTNPAIPFWALLFLAMCSLSGCRKGPDLKNDYKNEYLVNGHIVVKGTDLGSPSQVAFEAALNDFLGDLKATGPISPGSLRALRDIGHLYCWEKKNHPEISDPDLVQVTTAKFHGRFKPRSADEVVEQDAAASIAEKTWCPLNFPNPVTQPPDFPANGYK